MSKAVLISINPKWCELIASGKKTIEVRKTRPKLETPFKCYIYMTAGNASYPVVKNGKPYVCHNNGGREVIGEFVCDAIFPMLVEYSDPESRLALREFPFTCLTDKQIMDYLGNGKEGYGWHISNLVIYDKPKELSEFYSYNCGVKFEDGYPMPTHEIKRPPQSWYYVEKGGAE